MAMFAMTLVIAIAEVAQAVATLDDGIEAMRLNTALLIEAIDVESLAKVMADKRYRPQGNITDVQNAQVACAALMRTIATVIEEATP